MNEKLNRLFVECIDELNSIGIDILNNPQIGEIDINIAKRNNKRYGCCKYEEPDENYKIVSVKGHKKYIKYERFFKNHIEISKWVLNLNEEIIKNTIMHEIIHCFPFCNNHGRQFKRYANYINTELGYNIERAGNKQEDYKKSNLEYNEIDNNYKYKLKCEKCGQLIYRKRFNERLIKKYKCGICNGKINLIYKV